MYHDFTYEAVLASSLRAQWKLDDVLRADQELDFSRNMMPESLAGTAALPGLSEDERRTLNQIVAHQYLHLFGMVEEFILPFVLDHARPMLHEDDFRVRALLNFASEEAKHIHLFKRFCEAFARGFPVDCRLVGPRETLSAVILNRHPLAVGLIILMIEWMTQEHYLGSIRDNQDLDPLFKSLMRNHWMEEAQHAKLDTLIVEALAEGRAPRQLNHVFQEFGGIVSFIDKCLGAQAKFNIETLERASGRPVDDTPELVAQLHTAARWTYLGSGLAHPRFKATVEAISPALATAIYKLSVQVAAPVVPRLAAA